MTSGDRREAAPDPWPEGGKQRQEAANREVEDGIGSRPEFVIEIWASPQLGEQNPGRAPSLSEALGRQPAPRRDRERDPEPEIEP